MSEHKWKPWPHADCPSCGNTAEVFTASIAEGIVWGGDMARCVECGHPGAVSIDDSEEGPDGSGVAEVWWHDDPAGQCCGWCKMQAELTALRADLAARDEAAKRLTGLIETMREPCEDYRRALCAATSARQDDGNDSAEQSILIDARLRYVSAANRVVGAVDARTDANDIARGAVGGGG